ncbi:CbrC family protein [Cytophagaceae bacterium YF14B1]|uniref:CbrC family protein n=1 Tax=Xanthocytophaga flava TaxID=3048013 RepID=A0AAE3QTL3_9BACT|nr:CbrC family protein [Xanthocytophaga flavus]MDJ1485205.1 CbrC family protein [Xanthocytophaga flavus]
MKLPVFKYSPNVYELGVFDSIDGVCSICNEQRDLKYTGSFYSIHKPDYICPFCIADGKAAEKYNGEFNDYLGIEGVSPDPNDPPPSIAQELLIEVTEKTPGYHSFQPEVWLTHCGEPCALIGYADSETIKPYLTELRADIEYLEYSPEYIINHLTKDGSLAGYLFQCLTCGQHRLHVDGD